MLEAAELWTEELLEAGREEDEAIWLDTALLLLPKEGQLMVLDALEEATLLTALLDSCPAEEEDAAAGALLLRALESASEELLEMTDEELPVSSDVPPPPPPHP